MSGPTVTAPGVPLSLSQFRAAWRAMIEPSGAGTFETRESIAYVFSGLPISFFNIAVLTDDGLSADALTAQATDASAWAASHGVPWFLIVTHENLAPGVDATAVLDAAGFAPALPLTGMYAAELTAAAPVPDGLQLTIPEDVAGWKAIVDVNGGAYGMDLSASTDLLSSPALWRDHVPVLGTVDGAPVCSTGVLMVEGHRYVALVATAPGHQRRGFGDAVMRHALAAAAMRFGDLPTVLHATDAGRPVYARMGYAPISTHTLFMEKALAGGH